MIRTFAVFVSGLFLGVCWAAGQTLNSGEVKFRAHDPYGIGGPWFYGQMDAALRANSFGRNWFDFQLIQDCPTLPCGVGCFDRAAQAIDYSMTCGPFAGGWDIETVFHETGHLFGVGEGAAWDYSKNPPERISNYGDPYDPEGSGGFGRHWNAFYKEVMGFLGDTGLRLILLATNSGTYYISNAEDQSEGAKALKVLRSEYILYREDGTPFINAQEFYYLEVRTDHVFFGASSVPASSSAVSSAARGHGHKHPHASSAGSPSSLETPRIGPAVQARLGTPHYAHEPYGRIPFEAYLVNIGDYGGLGVGMSFSDTQRIAWQVTYFGATNYVSRPFSVNVISVDDSGASVQVNFQ